MGKIIQIGHTAKYEILKSGLYQNYIFLLSIVQTPFGISSMWSTHKNTYGEREQGLTLNMLKNDLQKEHDRQIDNMILQEIAQTPVDPKAGTVMDITKQQLEQMGIKR